jgi:membrane glycosyltransferase
MNQKNKYKKGEIILTTCLIILFTSFLGLSIIGFFQLLRMSKNKKLEPPVNPIADEKKEQTNIVTPEKEQNNPIEKNN